jgi:hypothetical protein
MEGLRGDSTAVTPVQAIEPLSELLEDIPVKRALEQATTA